ncbi:MAG: siderophore synthetase [Nitrospira sp.]|nr:siderophore synthetase [Nitrospira sp.]
MNIIDGEVPSPAAGDLSVVRAERAAIQRLLNTYLRETGQYDSRCPDTVEIPSEVATVGVCRPGTSVLRMVLPRTNQILWGTMTAASPSGYHRYGNLFYLHQQTIPPQYISVWSWKDIAGVILEELGEGHPDPMIGEEQARALFGRLKNSVEKTICYVDQQVESHRSSFLSFHGPRRFQLAEQSLIFGHPLHPTPKSSEGFSADDVSRYAPELGAEFTLSYFAVSQDLCVESPSFTDHHFFPTDVLAAAAHRLGARRDHYRLIPCHPWQADHLRHWPEVQALLQTEQLVDMGSQGAPVFPTSSVRTVWSPTHPYGFKLPLNVRITNFIRTNPLEHLQRAVDAGRVLVALRSSGRCADITILLERGYRTVMPPGLGEEQRSRFAESWGVLLRENPFIDESKDCPIVVAALLECEPEPERPRLKDIMDDLRTRDAGSDVPILWTRRYLNIVIVPLLKLFLEHGVSLEGHVQNTLLLLRGGWPERLYIRDLEGVAIGRSRATEQRWFEGCLAETSPALMADDEAWKRLKYYVFVNHLGHMLYSLAWCTGRSEMELWRIVADTLEASPERSRYPAEFDDLLDGNTLPAKANLTSCFLGRGEKPLYVAVPNLIREARRCLA